MCTNLIPISTCKPNYRQIVGGKGSLIVPCGRCPECLQAKQMALYQRCYMEYDYIKNHSGYVYWDTLTCNDDYIVNVDGKLVVPRRYFTLFMKRLRKALGSEYVGQLKYFVIHENISKGEDCRGHLHVFFFCHGHFVSLHHLKALINKCWKYGFTDSIYHTVEHVLDSGAAIMYVTKYLEKWFEYDHFDDKEIDKQYRPFYQCSCNLGYHDDVYDYDSKLRVCTADGYTYQDPCQYYLRKISMSKVLSDKVDSKGKSIPAKTDKGSYLYKINDRGIFLKLRDFRLRVQDKSRSYEECYCCLDDSQKLRVDELMACRSWDDLAVYSIVYKGVRLSSLYDVPIKFQNVLQDYCAILTCQNEQLDAYGSDLLVTPYSPVDVITYICENSSPQFHDFDKVIDSLLAARSNVDFVKNHRQSDHLHSINRLKSYYYD